VVGMKCVQDLVLAALSSKHISLRKGIGKVLDVGT
jgi:hypothetical protein